VNILYRRELAAAADPDALRDQRITEYEDTLANPYIAAERGYVDAVIRPAETRPAVTRALRSLRTKRQTLPPKKHGNIPLLPSAINGPAKVAHLARARPPLA
jgi:propionyl-CoA carboxylase beta chain